MDDLEEMALAKMRQYTNFEEEAEYREQVDIFTDSYDSILSPAELDHLRQGRRLLGNIRACALVQLPSRGTRINEKGRGPSQVKRRERSHRYT